MSDGMDEMQRRANMAMQEGLERAWARQQELTTLRAENEKLRAALETIAIHRNEVGGKIARAALAEEKKG